MDGWHPEACRAGIRWPASWSAVGRSTPSARRSTALAPSLSGAAVVLARLRQPTPGQRRAWSTRWSTCCRTRAAPRSSWARACTPTTATAGTTRCPSWLGSRVSVAARATGTPYDVVDLGADLVAAPVPDTSVLSGHARLATVGRGARAGGGRPCRHRPGRRVCRGPGDAARRGSRGGRCRSRADVAADLLAHLAADAGRRRRARGERGTGRRPARPAARQPRPRGRHRPARGRQRHRGAARAGPVDVTLGRARPASPSAPSPGTHRGPPRRRWRALMRPIRSPAARRGRSRRSRDWRGSSAPRPAGRTTGASPADPVLSTVRAVLTPLVVAADDPAGHLPLTAVLGAVGAAATGRRSPGRPGWTRTPSTAVRYPSDSTPRHTRSAPMTGCRRSSRRSTRWWKGCPENADGMRWRLVDGATVFEVGREVRADFDEWVARVDVAAGHQPDGRLPRWAPGDGLVGVGPPTGHHSHASGRAQPLPPPAQLPGSVGWRADRRLQDRAGRAERRTGTGSPGELSTAPTVLQSSTTAA